MFVVFFPRWLSFPSTTNSSFSGENNCQQQKPESQENKMVAASHDNVVHVPDLETAQEPAVNGAHNVSNVATERTRNDGTNNENNTITQNTGHDSSSMDTSSDTDISSATNLPGLVIAEPTEELVASFEKQIGNTGVETHRKIAEYHIAKCTTALFSDGGLSIGNTRFKVASAGDLEVAKKESATFATKAEMKVLATDALTDEFEGTGRLAKILTTDTFDPDCYWDKNVVQTHCDRFAIKKDLVDVDGSVPARALSVVTENLRDHDSHISRLVQKYVDKEYADPFTPRTAKRRRVEGTGTSVAGTFYHIINIYLFLPLTFSTKCWCFILLLQFPWMMSRYPNLSTRRCKHTRRRC